MGLVAAYPWGEKGESWRLGKKEMKIKEIVIELAQTKLPQWEKRFIASMFFGLEGTGDINDQEVSEYLTDKQINKVKEIWKRRIK